MIYNEWKMILNKAETVAFEIYTKRLVRDSFSTNIMKIRW